MEGKNKRTLILLGLLLALLAISYPYLSKNWQHTSPSNSEAPVSSPQMSVALSQLESVRLDLSVFQNKVLKQLKDFTLAPLNLSIGKSNPFK